MSDAFPDIGSVGQIEKKKNTQKKHKNSGKRRPWYPRMTLKVNIHISGYENVQYTVKNVSVFVPVFLYAVTMLIF